MAITVVTSSPVVPAFSVREPSLSVNAQRERALATPPSAITRISSEGKLRAELERQPIAVPTLDNVALPDTLPRPSDVGEAHNRVESNVAQGIRSTQQLPVRTALEPRAEVPTEPQHVDQKEAAPVFQVTRVASVPTARLVSANAAVENVVNTNTPVTDDRVSPVKISHTANEFAAAFTEFQNKRNSVLEKAAPVNQTQAADAPELRVIAPSPEHNAPLAVENVTRVGEAGSTRFAVSTFAVGVARKSTLQKINPENALLAVPTPDDTNDTRRIVRAEVTHGAPTPLPVSASSTLTEAANQAQTQPSAATQRLQNVQQNSADSRLSGVDQEPSGLAKHLNVLANLLTP